MHVQVMLPASTPRKHVARAAAAPRSRRARKTCGTRCSETSAGAICCLCTAISASSGMVPTAMAQACSTQQHLLQTRRNGCLRAPDHLLPRGLSCRDRPHDIIILDNASGVQSDAGGGASCKAHHASFFACDVKQKTSLEFTWCIMVNVTIGL